MEETSKQQMLASIMPDLSYFCKTFWKFPFSGNLRSDMLEDVALLLELGNDFQSPP